MSQPVNIIAKINMFFCKLYIHEGLLTCVCELCLSFSFITIESGSTVNLWNFYPPCAEYFEQNYEP